MFRPLRLAEAFEHVATADEWRWFGPMVARRVMHFGLDGWPLYTQDTLRRYDDLYRKLLIRVHDKLRSGEWLARGISPSLGPESRPIDPALWDYMDIVHRTEFAEGGGHRLFIAAIAGVQTVRPPVPQAATALLRAQLTRWIREQAKGAASPPTRAEQLAAARDAFSEHKITSNLYRDCRRAAELEPSMRQKGRPKAKGSNL